LQITTHNLWKRTLVRSCLGFAALTVATTAARAQTYYYYPSTVGTSSVTAAGATSTPTYYMPATYQSQATAGTTSTPAYYMPATYQSQATWNGYSPQYYQLNYTNPTYQVSYTPQYYQTSYSQPTYAAQAPQATAPETQYVQTSYVQETSQAAVTTATGTTASAATTMATTATVPVGDPYGFTAWLNSTRAAYGLPAVGYDPNLESWAAMNSAQQASSGIGHFVMGPARRQNSAMGGFPGIESMWMASGAHRAALLDPTIRWIGIASYGAYWTFNAY
jgi:Cysteine-rich secretory protein family